MQYYTREAAGLETAHYLKSIKAIKKGREKKADHADQDLSSRLILELLADPTRPDPEDIRGWVGPDFDPRAFLRGRGDRGDPALEVVLALG